MKTKIILYICLIFIFFGINQVYPQLSVHGYLTQAYGFSSDHQIFGIPNSGTSDLRNLALQFRYDINDDNNIIIQLSHERMGLSPLMQLKNDVELDWAFFEHRFNEETSIRVGKILLPFGVYNEIRDVGTLLPFFHLPYGPYGNGNYMSETLDGLSITHQLDLYSDWIIAFDVYGGRWNWIEWLNLYNPITKGIESVVSEAEIEKGVGIQLKITPPLEQLSFTAGVKYGHVSGGLSFQEGDWIGERNFIIFDGSFDADFDQFFIRGEYFYLDFENIPMSVPSYYLQAGFYFTEELILVSQYEYFGIVNARITPNSIYAFGAESGSFDYNKGFALGLNYVISSNLVIKAEHHWNESFLLEDKAFLLLVDDPVNTMHTIISVSTSF